MTFTTKADISGATRALNGLSRDVKREVLPKSIARISLKGERYIKGEAPVLTGTLRRGLHAYPSAKPTSIAHSTTYTYYANARSSRPGFIQKTVAYVERIAGPETEKVLDTYLKRM